MSPRRSRRHPLVRLADLGLYAVMRGVMCAFGSLPAVWIDGVSDVLGLLLYLVDRRGRRVGRQNLDVVFGDDRTPREKRRILRASMRETIRSMVVVLHAAPLTNARFRRWVDVPPEVEETLREAARRARGAVVVSAHTGNWEILLGLARAFEDIMPVMFLVEASFHPAVNRFLAALRGAGGGLSASRKGGARVLSHHVRGGGAAGLVVDRNIRKSKGGVWAPFFGLQARTTPLPAMLARGHDVPIAPVFCLPDGNGRYRIRLARECSQDVRTADFDADLRTITTRLNRIVEEVIRERPESWNWTLKRFKDRPTEERGRYPPYSRWRP